MVAGIAFLFIFMMVPLRFAPRRHIYNICPNLHICTYYIIYAVLKVFIMYVCTI